MSEFLVVLSLYYACDALMTQKPLMLTNQQLTECTGYYDTVKARFVDGPLPDKHSADGIAARRAAYTAFKAWELENGLLVTHLRAQAEDYIRQKG